MRPLFNTFFFVKLYDKFIIFTSYGSARQNFTRASVSKICETELKNGSNVDEQRHYYAEIT